MEPPQFLAEEWVVEFEWWSVTLLIGAFLGAAAGLAGTVRREPRSTWALVPWWPVAAGLLLRLVFGPFALVHENRHAFSVALPEGVSPFLHRVHAVVSSHYAGAGLLQKVVGTDVVAVFGWNLWWSTVAIATVGVLVTRAAGPVAGLAVSWMVAVQPLAVLMASTEEFMVAAAGMGLAGVVLLVAPREDARRFGWVDLAATSLIALAASTRDVALPLALLLPIALAGTAPRDGRWPWGRWAASCGLLFVLLLPRTALLLSLALGDPHGQSLVHVPAFPFFLSGGLPVRTGDWVGWQVPWIAPATGYLAAFGAASMVAAGAWRRDWRWLLLLPGVLAVFHVSGGLVRTGWFPSTLRHQSGAMVVWMVPAGWLLVQVLSRVGPLRRRAGFRHVVAVTAIAAASLGGRYEFDTPGTREFRLLQEGIDRAGRGEAVFLTLSEPGAVGSAVDVWIAQRRPNWRILTPAQFEADPEARTRVTHVMLDRLCFFNRALVIDGESEDPPPVEDPVPTHYGRMHRHCADVLRRWPWDEALSVGIHHEGRLFDFPPFDTDHRLAWLTFTPSPRPSPAPPSPRSP